MKLLLLWINARRRCSKTKEKTKHFNRRATRASSQFEHWQVSTSLSKRSSSFSNFQLFFLTSISQVSSFLQTYSSFHSSTQIFSSFASVSHSFSSLSLSFFSASHSFFQTSKFFSSTRSLRRRKWRRSESENESERSRRQRREFNLWIQDRIRSRRLCKRMSWEESKVIRSKFDNSRKRIMKKKSFVRNISRSLTRFTFQIAHATHEEKTRRRDDATF